MSDTGDASLEPAIEDVPLPPVVPPAPAAPLDASDPRAVARDLTERLDDATRRLCDFHATGDIESAKVVGGQIAAFNLALKDLIG